jgi:ActR/RegA family two-component response regulator
MLTPAPEPHPLATPYPPPLEGARPVFAVMSDLLFRSKIDDAARRNGLELRAAKSLEQLERHLGKQLPSVAFVDLEAESPAPSAAIRALRERVGDGAVRIIGFAGHTNIEAIEAGRAAGATLVLARSGLTSQLPTLLARVAEAERARASS